jgi:hypothetical protein
VFLGWARILNIFLGLARIRTKNRGICVNLTLTLEIVLALFRHVNTKFQFNEG